MKRTVAATLAAIFLLAVALVSPVKATVPLDDTLTATENCEALQSIREQKNPGNARLTIGKEYPVIGKNKEKATHYLLKIDDVSYNRWVEKSCGNLSGNFNGNNGPKQQDLKYVLALSWQPAFCESTDTPECETLESRGSSSFAASHFTLHGLWPQQDFDPNDNQSGTGRNDSLYCGVSHKQRELDQNGDWKELSPTGLTDATLTKLKQFMPGVASGLHRHEWYKHGTCYSDTPQEYYNESLALQKQINDSKVRDLFANNVGNDLTADEIRQAFDDSFGSDAGDRVAIECRNNNIQELEINLAGTVEKGTKISELMSNASAVSDTSCDRGRVDRF